MSYQDPYGPTGQSNTLAIVSLVLGILSLVFFPCCCLPFVSYLAMVVVPILALAAIITGFLGLSAAKTSGTGKGMAMGGLITGFGSVLLGLIYFVIIILAMFGVVALNVVGNL